MKSRTITKSAGESHDSHRSYALMHTMALLILLRVPSGDDTRSLLAVKDILTERAGQPPQN